MPSQDAQWWLLSNSDGALVSSADGTTTSWYQRDPELFRTLMTRERWRHTPGSPASGPSCASATCDAAAEVTSPQRWRETFEASVRKD